MKSIKNIIYINPLTKEPALIAEEPGDEGSPQKISYYMLSALKGVPLKSYNDVEVLKKAYDRVTKQKDAENILLEDEDFNFIKEKVRTHKPYLSNALLFSELMGKTFDEAENVEPEPAEPDTPKEDTPNSPG